MKLLEVSKTAFMTLGMCVVESEQENPIIKDHIQGNLYLEKYF